MNEVKKKLIEEAMSDLGAKDFNEYVDIIKKLLNLEIIDSTSIKNWLEICNSNLIEYVWETESFSTLLQIGEFKDISELRKYLDK